MRAALYGFFFLSGAAGPLYEVAWIRQAGTVIGNTTYAVGTVVGVYMGGLALGNAWLGRFADRAARPLAVYGWLEIGIAVYALLFPLYFELCQSAYVSLGSGASPGSPWLLVLKYIFSFAMILLPTTLMGGTLPVLTRLVTRSLDWRLEGPLRSMPDRPPNLLDTPPLPFPMMAGLARGSRVIMTDSAFVAEIGAAYGVPVAALGDFHGARPANSEDRLLCVTPETLDDPSTAAFFRDRLDASPPAVVPHPADLSVRAEADACLIRDWIARPDSISA